MLSVDTKVSCFHCGDTCTDQTIIFDDKYFCCHGCEAVYELITNSDLTQYYANDDLRAKKVDDDSKICKQYVYLDDLEVAQKLIRFTDSHRTITTFHLPGIHCSSCIYLLEHLPHLDQRIWSAEVNFMKKEITLTFGHEISLKEVAIILASLGYPPEINLEENSKETRKSTGLGLKIAIAGFCFGNSMLISLPEYLDADFQFEQTFKVLFGWINLGLSLPVILFAASDYYKSAWIGLKHRHLNIDVPIALGIITLFARSVYEIVAGIGPGYVDSLNGLIFFLLLGRWYQAKSYQALSFERDYRSYFPIAVTRLEDGQEEQVMIKDLKPGDEVIIHNQELIPADSKLAAGVARIDYAFVTGESDLVDKQVGEQVFAGGRQIGSQITLRLDRAVNNSELTQLWNNSEPSATPQHEAIIDKVSRSFTVIIMILASLSAFFWYFHDSSRMWDVVASVLIVACPCALALALPFALGHGMRALGARGIYLKNARVLERLARIREMIFDKTGTLTKNDPASIDYFGIALSTLQQSIIKTACGNSAHPLSKLVTSQFTSEIDKLPMDEFEEELGLGIRACVSGQSVLVGSSAWVGAMGQDKLHESRVYVSIGGNVLGFYRIKSHYRSGIFKTLTELKNSYKLHLLSGDNATEETNLKPYLDEYRFEQKPNDKLEYVQSIDQPCLMIGDGLNDAGALKAATVGIAVSEDIHQFSPGCDAIMEANQIAELGGIMNFANQVRRVVIVAFVISFLYNIIGLIFAMSGNLTPVVSAILMPVSSVTVVLFITLTISVLSKRVLRVDLS